MKNQFLIIFLALFLISLSGFSFELYNNQPKTATIFKVFPPQSLLQISTLNLIRQTYQIVNLCQSEIDPNSCYFTTLFSLRPSYTTSQLISSYLLINRLDPGSSSCHLFTHQLASLEYQEDPQNFLASLNNQNLTLCQGGLLHGLLDTITKQKSESEISQETIEDFFASINPQNPNFLSYTYLLGSSLLVDQRGDTKSAQAICNSLSFKIKPGCLIGIESESQNKTHLLIHQGSEDVN